jgi:HK97 family phage prohead protease
MKIKKRLDVELSIKSISDSGEFEGYGSIFGIKDSHSDIVVRGAFTKSLNKWIEKGRFPALLWQHNMDEPIGVYTEMKEDENGLYLKGRLLIDDDPLAKRAHAHMKAGSLSGLSIGYVLEDYDYDNEKEAFVLKDIDLWEVSLVTFPANDEARISNVKNAFERGQTPRPSEMEKALREVGLSASQAKGFMAKGYKAISPREAGSAETRESLNHIKTLFKES